jgi:hypothetical protein
MPEMVVSEAEVGRRFGGGARRRPPERECEGTERAMRLLRVEVRVWVEEGLGRRSWVARLQKGREEGDVGLKEVTEKEGRKEGRGNERDSGRRKE